MPDAPEDVQPDSSPAPAPDPVTPEPEPAPVSGEVAGGRTIDNVYGELSRKQQQTQQTLEQILAVLSAVQQPRVEAQPKGWDQYDDAQLAQLAQSGSSEALAALTQRHASREVEQRTTVQRQVDFVHAQLAGLYQKYPQLSDASNPLTQAAMRAKLVLTQSGKPNTKATDVEAIMLAIADNPGLAVSQQPQTPASRRVDPGPQGNVDGATVRRSPNRPAPKVDPKVAELARRYGVDPAKAMENFRARQTAGRSGVSPQVAMIVREQGGDQ